MPNLLDNAVMISLSFSRFGNSRKMRANEEENGVQVREIDPRVIRISDVTKFDASIREYVGGNNPACRIE